MNKRNEEVIELVQKQVFDNINVSEQTKSAVSRLMQAYENATYAEHTDRHKWYRDVVDDMVNDCSFRDDELAEKMANNHPTLQQSFMRMCLKFIKKMAEKTYFDGRNEDSVKLAKTIVESIKDNDYLPFV